MQDLNIAQTQSTPAIRTDIAAGTLELRGDSYPENSFELFEPLFRWVEEFLAANAGPPLAADLHLLYLNTSSVKAMMDIFDLLQGAHDRGRSVAVRWFYSAKNARVAELAGEFKEDYSFPFSILPSGE